MVAWNVSRNDGALNAGKRKERVCWRASAAMVWGEMVDYVTGIHHPPTVMFRLSRPLYQVVKQSTGIKGLNVHPDPLPALTRTYESTLKVLGEMPTTSIYRQAVEALTLKKLNILHTAAGDVSAVEKALEEGQIEQSLDIAADELKLASKMLEWKAWEPLEEKPHRGQWEYAAESHS